MTPVSFFDEQARRWKQSIFFVMLGILWMGIMGWLVVGANANLLSLMEVDGARIREWSMTSSIIAILLWAGLALTLLLNSGRFIPRLIGARKAEGVDDSSMMHTVECIRIAAGETSMTPNLHVLETDAINAFACGNSINQGSVVVTRGMLNRLNEEELKAVLAHEIAHLKNGDAQFIAIALAFAWMVLGTGIAAGILACLVAAAMIYSFILVMHVCGGIADDEVGALVCLVLFLAAFGILLYGLFLLAAYLLAAAAVFVLLLIGVKAASSAISQSREYLADACAVQWTRNPLALASALRKVSSGAKVDGMASSMVAPLWISDARSTVNNGFLNFLMTTHPDMDQRLERLAKMAGSQAVTDGRWLLDVRPTWQVRIGEWLWPLASSGLAVLLTTVLVSKMLLPPPAQARKEELVHVHETVTYPLPAIPEEAEVIKRSPYQQTVIPTPTPAAESKEKLSQKSSPSLAEESALPAVDDMSGELFPQTRLKRLSFSDLEGFSSDMTQYAINEMLARHGAEFGKKELDLQFQKFQWYRPRKGLSFDEIEKGFSTIEKSNYLTLAEHRRRLSLKPDEPKNVLKAIRPTAPPPPARTTPRTKSNSDFDEINRY